MNAVGHVPNLVGQDIQNVGREKPEDIEQVKQLAQQFEGVFLSLLSKELRATIEGDGLFGSESSDSYGGLFDMFIGEHLASAQPLGIASLFVEHYEHNLKPDTNPSSTLSTKA